MPNNYDNPRIILFDHFLETWLAFSRPLTVVAVHQTHEVLAALRAVEEEVAQGKWAAGFITYEAAAAFDAALAVHEDGSGLPLLWFGIFDAPQSISAPSIIEEQTILAWQASIDVEKYNTGFNQIKEHIARGDSYQVNYTFRLHAPFQGKSEDLFARAVHAQGSGYPGFVDLKDWSIASASPELFFTLDGEKLISKPMKGTAPRGLRLADDLKMAEWLKLSEKNRAENVMIVDMVRNDMGRIARVGSVKVPKLFDVEKYRTVWQMTSTVECETAASVCEIFQALFPAASITGAPKARTMQIIKELEGNPRRIYTGTLGYIAPGRQAQFNVAIRTALVDKRSGQVEYGLGGGIVWDSEQNDEFREAYTKANILTQTHPQFSLLETILWSPDSGYELLDRHLNRMEDSAQYFDFAFNVDEIRRTLADLANQFHAGENTIPKNQRVRLCVNAEGEIEIETYELKPLPTPYRIRLADKPISGQNPFLFHKTTFRKMYQKSDCKCCDDILLWNELGEVTESTIANLVVVKKGEWITPPVHCGLLPGTARAQWLSDGKIREAVIRVDELADCEEIYLLNSVRGLWKVELINS
ncbi:MAG: aminodeoxychorismate synthase component I [Anaerolineaceae bacterium]|nr:aminodeoxychorismate synthase component I [Anaerolineaceae bacterium]